MTPDAPPIAAVSRDTSPIRSTGTPMLFAYVGGPLSIPNGTCGGTRIDSYDILRETHTFVLSGCTAYGGEGESCGGPVERETSCSTFYIVSGDIRRLNTIILLCCSGSS